MRWVGVVREQAEFLERAGAEHSAAGFFPRCAVVEKEHAHADGRAFGGEAASGRSGANDGDVGMHRIVKPFPGIKVN